MRSSRNLILYRTVNRLLRPLVRILLRNGVPFGAFVEVAKRVYVDMAMAELGIPGRKQSVSRASIITGLSRKEVSRVKALPNRSDTEAVERYNRAAQVISGWVRDKRFADKTDKPADLLLDGRGATFTELVKRYSGDVPARAVRDELLRVGAVEHLPDGRIRLLARAYIPRTGEVDKLEILGIDVGNLISTIDHNLLYGTTDPYFQRKVSYDNLPGEVIPELRTLTTTRAQAFLEEMDGWMSQYDRDINPSTPGTGRRRAGIGIYYFEEDLTEKGDTP